MPIKFRCRKCRQLLGIAKSQAGTFVDCPQCGRSVQVPAPHGYRPEKPHITDKSFEHALAELSELADQPETTQSVLDMVPEEQYDALTTFSSAHHNTATSDSERHGTLHKSIATVPHQAQQTNAITLQNSLTELAALDQTENGEVSDELLAEMRAAKRAHTPLTSMVFLAAIVGIALGGIWWSQNQPLRQQPEETHVSTMKPAAISNPVDADFMPKTQRLISGMVQYQSGSGQLLPDRSATIIALPKQRQGTLKLNESVLRQPASDPDRRMTLAALRSLGADVAIADDAGNYSIECHEDCDLLVISGHVAQDSNQPMTPPQLAAAYFESPTRLIGKLKFQQATLGTSNTHDFVFSK